MPGLIREARDMQGIRKDTGAEESRRKPSPPAPERAEAAAARRRGKKGAEALHGPRLRF